MPAAVEQHLEQFQTDRDGDKQKEKPSASGTDLVLYRFGLYLRISDISLYHHVFKSGKLVSCLLLKFRK